MARKKPGSAVTVCDQLRQAIETSGLTQYRIAKKAGIRPEMIGRYVRRERDVRSETFAKIARALGLELTKKEEDQDG